MTVRAARIVAAVVLAGLVAGAFVFLSGLGHSAPDLGPALDLDRVAPAYPSASPNPTVPRSPSPASSPRTSGSTPVQAPVPVVTTAPLAPVVEPDEQDAPDPDDDPND